MRKTEIISDAFERIVTRGTISVRKVKGKIWIRIGIDRNDLFDKVDFLWNRIKFRYLFLSYRLARYSLYLFLKRLTIVFTNFVETAHVWYEEIYVVFADIVS